MGRMTFGVIFGVQQDPPEALGEDGWGALIDRYRGSGPTSPKGDYEGPTTIGFWVAVGGSGVKGCPRLSEPFAIVEGGMSMVPEYSRALLRARTAWEKFAAWAEKQGVWLDEPHLWLVETEVA
jgi:hypothetical protein